MSQVQEPRRVSLGDFLNQASQESAVDVSFQTYTPLTPERLAELQAQRPAGSKVVNTDYIVSRIKQVWFTPITSPQGVLRRLTCTIQLDNDFEAVGESIVFDPEIYNEELGRHYAYEDACNDLLKVFAFLKFEHLFQEKKSAV